MDVCFVMDGSASMEAFDSQMVYQSDLIERCKGCNISMCGPGCTDYSQTAYACQGGNQTRNLTGATGQGQCTHFYKQQEIMYTMVDSSQETYFKAGPDGIQMAAWVFSGEQPTSHNGYQNQM